MENKFLTIDQTAKRYEISKSWLYEQTRKRFSVKNAIPCIQIGKHIRFDPDELDCWFRNQGGSLKIRDIKKVSLMKGQ